MIDQLHEFECWSEDTGCKRPDAVRIIAQGKVRAACIFLAKESENQVLQIRPYLVNVRGSNGVVDEIKVSHIKPPGEIK